MASNKQEKWLSQAYQAYLQGDKHQGAQWIDKILRKDFNHPGTWDLLYRLYGRSRGFDDFRLSFAQEYYPELLDRLILSNGQPAAKSPEKSSLWKRLYSKLIRQDHEISKEVTPGPLIIATSPEILHEEGDTAPTNVRPPVKKPIQSEVTEYPASSTQIEKSGDSISPQTSGEEKTPISTQKIRVLVADDIQQTRDNIIRALRFSENIEIAGTAANGTKAIQMVRETKPDVVVMDINMPELDGITATATIRRESPFTQVVMLTVQEDIDYMRRAMLAGARDFLGKPPMVDELLTAILRAAEYGQQEKARAPAGALFKATAETLPKGKIITLYSPRGGCGCTTLAVNLAVFLHSTTEEPVILVDGNLQFGDIPALLNLRAKNTIRDIAPRADEIDAELIKQVILEHSSGLHVLAGTRPEQAEIVTGPQFVQILKAFAGIYTYVIIDTDHKLTDITLAAFDNSNLVVLVTSQDVPSIWRTLKFLDLAPRINLDKERLMIVMNPYDKRVNIDPEKVSLSFKKEFSAIIPLERETVVPSINRGVPFMLQKEYQNKPVATAILGLANSIKEQLNLREKLQPGSSPGLPSNSQ